MPERAAELVSGPAISRSWRRKEALERTGGRPVGGVEAPGDEVLDASHPITRPVATRRRLGGERSTAWIAVCCS